jgi:hypothetical protein
MQAGMTVAYLKQEEFEDTKGVIRIRISKNKQHNGQKKKYKTVFISPLIVFINKTLNGI